MSSVTDIDFIAAQIIINSLKGNDKLVIYKNPLEEFSNICGDIKKVVESYYSSLIPEDLPVSIDAAVGIEIYERTLSRDWSTRKDSGSSEENISTIMASYLDKGDTARKKYIAKSLASEPETFIRRLLNMAEKGEKRRLTETLDEWTDYDILNLFDEVSQPSKIIEPSTPVKRSKKSSKGSLPFKPSKSKPLRPKPPLSKPTKSTNPSVALEQFISKDYSEGEKIQSVKDLRTRRAREFENAFKKLGRGPDGYKKKGVPPYEYIRHLYLPWILASNIHGKSIKDVLRQEDLYYFIELNKYRTSDDE